MNEKQVLQQLHRLSQLLDDGQAHVEVQNWDAVAQSFGDAEKIQDKIKANTPDVTTMLAQNAEFKQSYQPLKASLMEKTTRIVNAIETWKSQHTGKIADSKNTLDNISKFYKPSSTSFYIDREE